MRLISSIKRILKFFNKNILPEMVRKMTELDDRFSKSNLKVLQGISSLSPGGEKFLEMDNSINLCNVIKCDVFTLNNEIQVLKSILEQSKSRDIVELYIELLSFQPASPVFIISSFIGNDNFRLVYDNKKKL